MDKYQLNSLLAPFKSPASALYWINPRGSQKAREPIDESSYRPSFQSTEQNRERKGMDLKGKEENIRHKAFEQNRDISPRKINPTGIEIIKMKKLRI